VKLIRQKKSMWKEVKYHNTGQQLENYKKLEKEVANKIRNAKRKVERELAFENDKNGRQFSNYVKSKTKSRTGIGPLCMEDGSVTADSKKMADALNSYFSSVFSAESLSNLPVKNRETEVELEHINFEKGEILKVLKNLKQSAAPGPDGISPRILKEMRFELVNVMQKIFQKSIDQAKVPADWKKATVTPIYKKGQKSDPANYRPVSLTSIPCKVMETVIKEKIMAHLQEEKLIKPSQHGFWPGRSCATNLLIFQDALTKAVDNGIPADIFYLDFAKAFDKVSRERLIIKLEAKGITGRLKNWIQEWLTGRTQVVLVHGEASEEGNVDSGVTQGTVLGPPLFTIHIDDIDDFARLIELLKKIRGRHKRIKTHTKYAR
jgi:transcriptional regulator of met regulon